MAPRWPQVNNGPEHINEHATYLKEACNQLQAVDKGRTNQVPWNIVHPYLASTIALIGKILRQPGVGEILQHVQDAARCTQNIQKDITIIKNTVGLSTAPLQSANFSGGRAAAASWARIAAQAKGPPSYPPPAPQGTIANETSSTVTAYKDRMVRIKLKDHGIVQRHRKHAAAWTKQQVETSIREYASTRTVKVVAAHQLKSGDIQIFTSTRAEASRLKQHKEWLRGLGEHAELIVPTYGVIVHDIPTNSIDVKGQGAAIKQILADNHTVISNAEISYIGWLTKEAALKRASSIVVEFTDPESANAIIYAGMAWEGQIHQCELYDRACRVMQCFRCYHYCHITTQCNASQVCGYCAEPHETKHCKQKEVERFTPQCAVCKGAHTAWSNACPARKTEMQRVERAKQARSIYWHVPPKQKEVAPVPTAMPNETSQATITNRPNNLERNRPTPPTTANGPVEYTSIEGGSQPPAIVLEEVQNPYEVVASTSIPSIEIWNQTAMPQNNCESDRTTDRLAMEIPVASVQQGNSDESGPALQFTEGTGEALQQADEWLNELSNVFDFEWPQQGEGTGPSPLTSIATDPRTATGKVYRSCRCEEHRGLYDSWPLQDAELTIVKCMKICMYCGRDFATATEMRRHIHRSGGYAKRNLKVKYGMQIIQNSSEPGWEPIRVCLTEKQRDRGCRQGIYFQHVDQRPQSPDAEHPQ